MPDVAAPGPDEPDELDEVDEPDEVDMSTVASALHLAAVEAAPEWARRLVLAAAAERGGASPSADQLDDLAAQVAVFVDGALGELLATDIDRQRTTPLSIFRDATRHATALLAELGVPPGAAAGVPGPFGGTHDPYGLMPANLADVGDEVQRCGIVWGAAKAHLHLRRRRAEGLR